MTFRERKRQEGSLKNRLIWRFAGFTAMALGLITAAVTFMFMTALKHNLNTSLSVDASHSLHCIEHRVAFLAENVTNFSKNHFIINSLIDTQGRALYLPKLVSDFSQVEDLSAVSIVDFEGNVIHSSAPVSPDDLKALDLRKPLVLGETLLQLARDLKNIVVVCPIECYQTPQGAVIAQFSIPAICTRILPKKQIVFHKLYSQNHLIFSQNFKANQPYLIEKKKTGEELPLLKKMGIELEMGALKSEYLAPVRKAMVQLVLVSIIFIGMAMIMAAGMGNSLARPILALCEKVDRSETFHDEKCYPVGTGDELEQLAQAFDRRAEQLVKAKDYVNDIIKTTPDSLVVVNNDATIRTVNRAARNLLGYEEHELIGKPVTVILEEEKPGMSGIEELMEKESVQNLEKIYLAKGGKRIPVLFSGSVMRDNKGLVQGTVFAAQDITESKQAEEVLSRAHDELEMRVKERTAELAKANETLEAEVTKRKLAEQELIKYQHKLEQMVSERTRELKEAQEELVNKAMEAGRAQLSAMILHNIGNAVTPVRVRLEKIKSDELKQVADYLETCYLDLTGHADGLQRYVNDDPRGKEIFSYMGSLIDSLKEHDEKRASATNKIEDAVSYISDILSMQQVYAATEQEIKELTSLNRLIEHGIEMQSSSLEKRGIVLKQNLEPNLPKLLVDKSRLMQVLINLIKNSCEAIDALRDDDREKVIAVKSFAAGGHVGFEITDSGIGIEPDRLDTIFKFGASSKGASGFGLYYSKLFVEANGGKISISSSGSGKGTTVSITFPAKT